MFNSQFSQMENNSQNIPEMRKKLKETSLFLLDILYNAVVIIVLVVLIRSFLVSPFRVVGHSMADTLADKEFILIDKLSYLVGDIDRGDPIVFLPPPMSSDQPKFEKTAETDSSGLVKVKIDNLKADKQTNYCQNGALALFWFCTSKPEENDLIYFAPELDGAEVDWNAVERLKLTKEDIEKGYLEINAEPNTTYDVRMYDSRGPEYFVKRVIGIPGDTVKIENGRVYIKGKADEDFREIEEPFLNDENFHQTYMTQRQNDNVFVVPEGYYFVLGDNRNHSNDSRSWMEPITQEPFPFVPEANISGKVMIVLWPLTDLRLIDSAKF